MNESNFPNISIIAPCLNEKAYIEEFYNSIKHQDYDQTKIEFIIVDGNSNDGTINILEKLKEKDPNLVVLSNPHKTTPHALNIGIKNSHHSIIVRVDCHAIYPTNYLKIVVSNLIELNADNVGVPFKTVPQNNSSLAIGISLAMSSVVAVGTSQHRTYMPNYPVQTDTVPYGCFKRELFDRIGYFSELLIRNQDDEFNNRIIQNGGKIYLLPGASITYYARSNFKHLFRMFYQYGLFKPLSNFICGRLSSIRQIVPLGFQLTCILLLILTMAGFINLSPLLSLLSIYCLTILFFGLKSINKKNKLSTIALQLFYFEIATIIIHQSYGLGYFLGFFRLIPKFRKEIDLAISR